MSKLFVDEIVHQSSQGSGTITLGASGEKITTASGAEFSAVTGHNYPAFMATQNATQNIANNTQTKIQFQSKSWDTDSAFDNTTNYRFTVPTGKAGKYFFSTRALIRSGDNKEYIILFRKNGVSQNQLESKEITGGGSGAAGAQTQGLLDLADGDYVEVFFYHTTGVTKDTYQNYTIFQGFRIGA